MINGCLSFFTPGPIELIIIGIVFAVPAVIIIMIVRALLRNRKENVKLRLEVGKLADELEKKNRGNGGQEEQPGSNI